MLDGRIDTQGTVKDLRERGLLDEITHDESVEAHKEEVKAEAEVKGKRRYQAVVRGKQRYQAVVVVAGAGGEAPALRE